MTAVITIVQKPHIRPGYYLRVFICRHENWSGWHDTYDGACKSGRRLSERVCCVCGERGGAP